MEPNTESPSLIPEGGFGGFSGHKNTAANAEARPSEFPQTEESPTPLIPTVLSAADAATANISPATNFVYQRTPELTLGTPENRAVLSDAAKSDKLFFVNAARSVAQNRRAINYRHNLLRRESAGNPEGLPLTGNFSDLPAPIQPEAEVLSSFGTSVDEIVTNVYFEQDRTTKEAEHYFNLIKKDLVNARDSGQIELSSLGVDELAEFIMQKGGLQDPADLARFRNKLLRHPYASNLGVSTSSKLLRMIGKLDPVIEQGEILNNEFMSGKWQWDPSNPQHRENFKIWSAYRDANTVDLWKNVTSAMGAVFAGHADLFYGISTGLISPNQYISEEWRSDPEKLKRVVDVLSRAASVSNKAQNILGLDDTRSLTEMMMGSEDPRMMLVATEGDIATLLQSDPDYSKAISELAQLEREGAFGGGRLRVLTSSLDGALQSIAGLAHIVTGYMSGSNPNGLVNEVISGALNIHKIVLGENYADEVISTKMRRANISRDLETAQADWMESGMIFTGPELYDKRQGGMGGQSIDITRGAGKLMRMARMSRYGISASERLVAAQRFGESVTNIANRGLSLLDAIKDDYPNYTLLRDVIEKAKDAGESISESEAVERIIAGKVSVNGVPLTRAQVAGFAGTVEGFIQRANKTKDAIDQVAEIFRKSMPDGSSLTPEQIIEQLGNDSLPTGAGRRLWEVVDALDPGVRKKLIARIRELGPAGQKILENIQAGTPDKGALYGAWRYLGSGKLWAGVATGASIGNATGNPWLGMTVGALATGATTWMYVVPDFLSGLGFIGDKAKMMDEYLLYSGSGTTLGGSAWLRMSADKMEQIATLRAKQVEVSAFPEQVAALQTKIDELGKEVSGAKTMHYLFGPSSFTQQFLDPIGSTFYSGSLQDVAFTLAVEDSAGMGIGGAIGSAAWNRAYGNLVKRGLLNNKDQAFARGMMELNRLYADKPAHQRAALIRVLERAQREGNVRETVSGILSANIRGVDIVFMPEHLASSAIYSWNERIRDQNGNIDFSATVESLINYGMTREEAERYIAINRQNEVSRTVQRTNVSELQTAADNLATKAEDKARGIIQSREKFNAAKVEAESKKIILQKSIEDLEAAKRAVDAVTNKDNPALSNVTPELLDAVKVAQVAADSALRDFNVAERQVKAIDERTKTAIAEVRAMRAEARAMAEQAKQASVAFLESGVPVGGHVFLGDGSIGRRIHEGAYVFDKKNGRRIVVLTEEYATRAGMLEEAFHAAEDDAVIQGLRRDSVDLLFGKWGRDENDNPVQTEQGYFPVELTDRFMRMYADGLPIPDAEKVAWLQGYEIAKKHYENTGDPRLLYRYTTEVMAKFYVARKMAMGLYPEKGITTPSTASGGFEGSASPGAGGAGTDFLKFLFGDLSLIDIYKASDTSAAVRQLVGRGIVTNPNDNALIVGMFGRGGLMDRLIWGGTLSYLSRSGIPEQSLGPAASNWSSGFMFDENGNRIKDPVIDNYINRFMRYMRRSEVGTAIDEADSSMTWSQLEGLTPEQQVIWATRHRKRHWLVERKDGKGYRLKPHATIVAEYNRSVDKVYTSLTNAINKHGTAMGIRLSIDDDGVEHIFGAPTEFGLSEINRIIRESDLPVQEQRNIITLLAGIAGSQPGGTHPGWLPMYDIAYSKVHGEKPDLVGIGFRTKRYTPYAIDIRRTRITRDGRKGDEKVQHLYLRVLDNEYMNKRYELLWNGQLLDENGVPLFTKEQVRAMFSSRHDISAHFGIYLQNLAGSVDPENQAGGSTQTNSGKPSRSWELFTTDVNDPESVARGKAVAEMMYRLFGTRPTKGMERAMGKDFDKPVRVTAAARRKAEQLQSNAKDFVLGEGPDVKTGITADWESVDENEVGAVQEGPFRLIRIDRIGSIVSMKDMNIGQNTHGMMPFSIDAYGLSQTAYGTRISWSRMDLAQIDNPQWAYDYWKKAPEDFRRQYGPRITDAYAHDGGYLVFRTKGSQTWTVAESKTGTIIAKDIKDPIQGFELANKYALDKVFQPNNRNEVALKNEGWHPRGLPDHAYGFRSLYQNKDGYTLERVKIGKNRFILRDPFGNVVSKEVVLGSQADILDTGQLKALMGQARENARLTKALRKQLPGLPERFLDFYPIHVDAAKATAMGIVGAANPTYYKIKDILNASIGAENSSFVLQLMRKELGDKVIHDDQKATYNWVKTFLTERFAKDPAIQRRLRDNFPEKTGDMMNESRGLFSQLLVLEEVSLALSGTAVQAGASKKPNRTLLLDSVLPQRRKVFDQRLEDAKKEAEAAAALDKAQREQSARNKKAADDARALAERTAQREDAVKNRERARNISAIEREAIAAEKAQIAADKNRVRLLEDLSKKPDEVFNQVLAELGPLLVQNDPSSWKGKDSLWKKARASVKEALQKQAKTKLEREALDRLLGEATLQDVEQRRPLSDYGSNFNPEDLGALARYELAVRKEYIKLWEKHNEDVKAREQAALAEKAKIDEFYREIARLENEQQMSLKRYREAQKRGEQRAAETERREAERLRSYAESLRRRTDEKSKAWSEDWDRYRAELALKDGVFEQEINDTKGRVNSFDQAMQAALTDFAAFEAEQKAENLNALNADEASRNELIAQAGRARQGLRLGAVSHVNNVLGNEYGWKIAEVYFSETTPKTWFGKAMGVLEDMTMRTGTEIDLQPKVMSQNVLNAIQYDYRVNQYGGQRLDQQNLGAPSGIPGLSVGKQVLGYVGGVAASAAGAVRVRYLVFNPTGALVATYANEQEAIEAAAGIHQKQK